MSKFSKLIETEKRANFSHMIYGTQNWHINFICYEWILSPVCTFIYYEFYCSYVEDIGGIKVWQIQLFQLFGGETFGEWPNNGKGMLEIA